MAAPSRMPVRGLAQARRRAVKPDEAADLVASLPQKVEDAIEAALDEVAELGRFEADQRTPVDTGTLRKETSLQRGKMFRSVAYNSPYGLYVHEGTGPHPIFPNEKKALAFAPRGFRTGRSEESGRELPVATYARGGRILRPGKRVLKVMKAFMGTTSTGVFIRKSAQHPGTKANPWLRDTIAAIEPQAPAIFARHLEGAFRT